MGAVGSAITTLLILVALVNGSSYFPVIGLGSLPQQNPLLFEAAARSPAASNNVSIVGYNFAGSPDSATTNVTSSQRWILQANYTAVRVNDSAWPENTTVPYFTYDFVLPQPNPAQDQTNWTLCRNYYGELLPSNITGNAKDEKGDCTAILGSDCVRDWLSLYESRARTSRGCPSPPFWKDVPSCFARTGSNYAMYSSGIMNYTSPQYIYSYGSWYNASSNGTSSILPANYTPPWHGLESYQSFTYELGSAAPANETQSLYNQNTGQVRLVTFALTPSTDFLNRSSLNFQYRAQGNLTRMVCLQVDPKVSPNAASSAFRGGIGWMGMGLTILLSLWLVC